MSVETTESNDLDLSSTKEIETLPETGGIVGGGLAILKEISTHRPHRRLTSRINRLLTTIAVAGLVLNSCAPLQASSSPSSPTEQPGITQPVDTSMQPILTDAQETGAMIANTQVGRDFYDALSVHGVDPSACSPDVLGKLVIEKNLPLGEVSDLVTITTDALANTPEPDHLNNIVCDVQETPNGTQTVSFFFHSDTDHTGDGAPDIYIPSQAKVLLTGELIDGVPQVVAPVVGGESPAGSLVTAPDWSPAGGEIPAEIRGLMTVEEQSIRYSLAEKNINTDSVLIHPVFRGSGDDFRMGSGVTNINQTIAFYPQFDDDGALAWRPDLRSNDRPWHWEQVSLPEGVDGKIEVVFDPDSEAPQFVALTPDESRMIGWFNNLTRQWLTGDGQELASAIPEPSATPAEAPPFLKVKLGNGEQLTIPAAAVPELVMPKTFYALDGEVIPENEVSKWAQFGWINENTDSNNFMKYHLTYVTNLTTPWKVSFEAEPTRYYTRIGIQDPKGTWYTYIAYLGAEFDEYAMYVRDHTGFSKFSLEMLMPKLIPGQLMQLEFIHDPPQDYVGPNTATIKRVYLAQAFDGFLDRLVEAIRSGDSFPEEAEGIIPAWTLTLP